MCKMHDCLYAICFKIKVLNLNHGNYGITASCLCSVYSVIMATRPWQDTTGSEVPSDCSYRRRAMATAMAVHIEVLWFWMKTPMSFTLIHNKKYTVAQPYTHKHTHKYDLETGEVVWKPQIMWKPQIIWMPLSRRGRSMKTKHFFLCIFY